MISLDGGFIFIHRGKSGGNSITTALLPFAPDNKKTIVNEYQDGVERFDVLNPAIPTRKHAGIGEYRDAVPAEVFERLYKFSIIRNPFDRLISAYFHPVRVMKFGDAFDEDAFVKIIQNQRLLRDFVCFNESEPLDAHLNRLVRYEHLREDFAAVLSDLGFDPSPLPVLNRSERGHYREYYSARTRSLVEERFAEEIKFGGYTF